MSTPGGTPSITDLADALRDFTRERDWERFHTPRNLVMALTVETAELLEIFQWRSEEESTTEAMGDVRDRVEEEVADVFLYLIQLTDVLGIDLLEVSQAKLKHNHEKYPADRVRGRAIKYTALEGQA